MLSDPKAHARGRRIAGPDLDVDETGGEHPGAELDVIGVDTDPARLAAVRELQERGAIAVVGDLSDLEETRSVADHVNRVGRMDAVIHNAGVIGGPQVLPVNVVAPYLLTALMDSAPGPKYSTILFVPPLTVSTPRRYVITSLPEVQPDSLFVSSVAP